MIIRYLPNGCRKVSNLLHFSRTLSATPASTESPVKDNGILQEMFSPENQVAKLQSTPIIEEPNSMIDQIPYMYQTLLDSLQVSSGVPWWGVLVGVGVVGRLLTLPAHVQLEKSMMAKLPLIRLEKEAVIARLSGDLVTSMKKFKESEVYRKTHGIPSSLRLLTYFAPGSILLALNFSSVYGLAAMNYAPLVDSSFLWLHSLCLSDPHRILSFVNGIMIAAIAKNFVLSVPDSEKSAMITSHKKKWYLLTFGAIFSQAALPASVLVYWSMSNLTRLLLIERLLRVDWFRTRVGLVEHSEKLAAFGAIPKVDTAPKAIQLAGNKDTGIVTVSEGSIRENELMKLWEEGDLEVLKTTIDDQKKQQTESAVSLEKDLTYCEDELKNMSFSEKFGNPISRQLATQQKVLQEQLKGAEKSKSRLDTMERKLAIAERKQKFQYLVVTEEEGELELLRSDLVETHSNLLDELEECETELGEVYSRKLQHFERYTKKQQLLKLQTSLLDDIQFCEREILDLPNLKRKISKMESESESTGSSSGS